MEFKWPHWLQHDWTNWEQYEQNSPLGDMFRKLDADGLFPSKFNGSPHLLEDERRQKRQCKVCGYAQDKEVHAW